MMDRRLISEARTVSRLNDTMLQPLGTVFLRNIIEPSNLISHTLHPFIKKYHHPTMFSYSQERNKLLVLINTSCLLNITLKRMYQISLPINRRGPILSHNK